MRSLLLVMAVSAAPAFSQTVYSWEDEDGVHYTDDLNQVPKGLKKVGKETLAPAPSQPVVAVAPTIAAPAAGAAVQPPAGRLDEKTWRDRFINGYRRIQTLKQSIAAMEHSLPPRLHCNTIVAPLATGAAAPTAPQQVCTVNQQYDLLMAELNQRRVALRDAELDLEQLERDATREQVPREWRRGW